MSSSQNYGAKAGDGVKGIFKSINDVGEVIRTNINGVFDSTGDAVAGRRSHDTSTTTSTDNTAHASTLRDTHSTSGTHATTANASHAHAGGQDSEHLRQSMNKGVDNLGHKLDGWMHHHK